MFANVITSTDRGSQLVGAAIGGIAFGGLGALAGALSGKTNSRNLVNGLALRIITDDGTYPVTFFDGGSGALILH
jgi:outer membrane lipoprotein SlyB